MTVMGGGAASTGRRSRREAVSLQRGFDGARAGEPEVGSTRALFVGAKRRRTNLLTGAAPYCPSNHPQQSMARSPVQQPVRPVRKAPFSHNDLHLAEMDRDLSSLLVSDQK